jgi:hypothetical protein
MTDTIDISAAFDCRRYTLVLKEMKNLPITCSVLEVTIQKLFPAKTRAAKGLETLVPGPGIN